MSLSTVDFWCWSEEQRQRHNERNKKRAKEKGNPSYDPVKQRKRRKEYLAYKNIVHGAEVMKQFKYEENKQRDPRRKAGVRRRRLERAVLLLKQHGKAWMEERYQHLPEFLASVYQHDAAQSEKS